MYSTSHAIEGILHERNTVSRELTWNEWTVFVTHSDPLMLNLVGLSEIASTSDL